jgi:ribonuclease HII
LSFPNLEQEALLWNEGSAFVFGVDEAGRGCLAGPVCAAVTCWAPHSVHLGLAVDVRDSKKMAEKHREQAFLPVQQLALAWGIGLASAGEIDRWNILRATHLAVARALETSLRVLRERALWSPSPADARLFAFLADGNRALAGYASFFSSHPEYRGELSLVHAVLSAAPREVCVIQGDSSVFSIASASVLAKVCRDRHMQALEARHPGYEFSVHKGYGTALHRRKLTELGPCPEHRRSFGPVTELVAGRPQAQLFHS